MKNNKIIGICFIIIIILAIGAIIFLLTSKDNNQEEFGIDGIGLVENKDVLNDVILDELKITDISLYIIEGISKYSATVINTKNSDINISKLYVNFYMGDMENKILALYDVTINVNGETTIDITSGIDFSKVTKISYTVE